MTLKELIDCQEVGLMKIGNTLLSGSMEIGGVEVSQETLKIFVDKLGWYESYLPDHELVQKTDKFIQGLKANIHNEHLLACDISFSNRRKAENSTTVDRIAFKSKNGYTIKVIYGLPNVGHKYQIFTSADQFCNRVSGCRTLKELGKYLDGVFELMYAIEKPEE